jgi:hypothetical protein
MGLTFRLGQLPTSLFTDASNNVGIGAAPSGSYKLEVTGTGNYSGVLRVGAATGFAVGSIAGYRRIEYSGTTFSLLTNADGYASLNASDASFSSSGVDGSLGSVVRISTTNTNGNARNWALVNTFDSYGDLNFRLSNAQGGNALTAGTTVLTLSRTGTTTFSNPVTINSTDTAIGLTLKSTTGSFVITPYYNGTYGGFFTSQNAAASAYLPITFTATQFNFLTGNVGIGLTNAGAPLEVIAGSATGTTIGILMTRALGYGSTQFKQYYNSGSDWGLIINSGTDSGGVKLVKDATSWAANTSDERKKKNFEPSQGLEELMKIEALKYHFEWDDDSIPKRMGFKAQNLLPLIPEMVLTTGDKAPDGSDYLTIIPDYLLPVLVKSIQELNERLNKAGL